MQIQISNRTAEKLARKLGIVGSSPSQVVTDLLDLLADQQEYTLAKITQLLRPQSTKGTDENAFELAQRLGVVGVYEGPDDLSTNRQHMDGFGR